MYPSGLPPMDPLKIAGASGAPDERVFCSIRILDEAFIEQQTYAWISLHEGFQRSTEEQVQGACSRGK
ncbi:g3665 [Coccomyxa elongata]